MELTIELPDELANKLAYIAYKRGIGTDTLAIEVLKEFEAAEHSVHPTPLSLWLNWRYSKNRGAGNARR